MFTKKKPVTPDELVTRLANIETQIRIMSQNIDKLARAYDRLNDTVCDFIEGSEAKLPQVK